MKLVKKLFYGLMILCMLLCGVVIVCALIPGLTDRIAAAVYGGAPADNEQTDGMEDTVSPGFSISESNTPGIDWENMPFQNQTGYVIPSRDQIAAPEGLSGKNGYREADGRTSEVEDEEGEKLQRELDLGELGEDLQFQELYYPYYAMLTEPMKQLYRQIYANAEKLKDSFRPAVEVSADQLYTVFEAVTGDHPELFFLETEYSCKYMRGGQVVEISLEYYDLADRIDSTKREFETAAEEILQGARDLESDLEKERYVHDALIEKEVYQASAARNQSAYSALVDGQTVCAGYARAFQYLLIQLGIPCYYCMGYSGEDHAWNIVYVDGMYRNVDVTWDDNEEDTYRYFNCSDRAYAGTHMRKGLSVYLPACPEEGSSEAVSPLDGIQGLINPNPTKPLTLADRGTLFPDRTAAPGDTDSSSEKENLREAGITEADVIRSLDAYYKDCETKLTKAGTGQVQFTCCIPASLWQIIEDAYTSGSHKAGYVDNALKTLEVDNFAINLQVVRLGGGYYRLYHTVATW